jgi:hypothetical protein
MSFTLPVTESCLNRSAIVGEAARFSDAFWVHPIVLKVTPTAMIIKAIILIRIWYLLVIENTSASRCACHL